MTPFYVVTVAMFLVCYAFEVQARSRIGPTPSRLPCTICMPNGGGVISVKNATLRQICIKGCVGPVKTSKKLTTTTTTTVSTKTSSTTTPNPTTTTKDPTTTTPIIYSKTIPSNILKHVILKELPDMDTDRGSMSKTIYLWTLMGFLTFGIMLCIVVLFWKHSKVTERNRIGSIVSTDSIVKREIFVLP